MLKQILNIVPKKKQKALTFFFIKSLLLNILDLVSIAYLIPIITLLLDKEKFYLILSKIGITSLSISDNSIRIVILFLIIFYIIKNIIYIRFNKKFFNFLYNLSNTLSVRAIKKFINKDFLFYQKQNKGNIINIVMKVTGDFCCKLLHSIILLFCEIIVLFIVVGFLLYFYPKFTLIALLVLGLFSLIIYYKKKSDFNIINTTYNESQTKANSQLINILDGFLEIKSSNNEEYFVNSFDKNNIKLNKVTALLVSSSFNYSKYLEITLIICLGILTYFSFISSSNANIILISTLAALGFKLVPSLSKILNAITHIKSHSYTIKMLNDIHNVEVQKTAMPISEFSSEVSLKNISFDYSVDTQILDTINFKIKPGDFLGITGVSGIGKTTFLYVMMGLVKPTKGKITVDGNLLNNMSFLQFISYVPQQPFLLSGTLLENITMGQTEDEIDYEYINFLFEKLELTEIVNELPEKYLAHIQHDSLRFSGGQKQRISIVRALYSKPKLLILDEATNQQNSPLELRIFEFLKEISEENNMAILSVSHNDNLSHFYSETFILENKKLILLE
ncbi:ATP-binding cassette domain-containing protein [Jejuia spongiicola]|uniref:ABC transporter ATP-binding protein/permease n=1 Tax=Jejuia spongiicola TaxID=2942207 RepID=A0ABT0QCR8_9FLAO|nr:ABC transporter ATP-binding protein [Jejuia spongiicola]MCL6294423.1 ABC transporter ATP-binding protein/permease [Jejuia spongiicola]